jgi:hypothetical protein
VDRCSYSAEYLLDIEAHQTIGDVVETNLQQKFSVLACENIQLDRKPRTHVSAFVLMECRLFRTDNPTGLEIQPQSRPAFQGEADDCCGLEFVFETSPQSIHFFWARRPEPCDERGIDPQSQSWFEQP